MLQIFASELSAKGQTDAAGWQFEKRGSVNIHVDGGEFGEINLFRMDGGEGNGRSIRWNRHPKVAKRIVGNGCADELRGRGIEDGIGCI